MFLSDIDFKGGVVHQHSTINTDLPLKEQIWELDTSILHVSYENGYFLDISWSRAFDLRGTFRIFIGKDNWDDLLYRKTAKLERVVSEIEAAVNKILSFIEK